MISLRLLSYIEKSLNQKGEVGKKGEVGFWCPICKLEKHKKKLSVNLDKDYKKFGQWHCWNCQVSNKMSGKNLFTLFKKLDIKDNTGLAELLGKKTIPKHIITEDKQNKVIMLPKEFNSLSKKRNSPEYNNALNYLYMRGVAMNDIIRYNIGYCETGTYSNRIIIPSYNEYGQLNYFVSRTYYNAKKAYINPSIDKDKVILFEMHLNWNYPIIIVEGIFDAIAAGSNAIPILGKHIGTELKKKIILNKVKDIYISLDSDAVKTSIRYIEEFIKKGVNVHYIDLNKKDPSELGKFGFIKAYENAMLMDFGNLVKLKLSFGI